MHYKIPLDIKTGVSLHNVDIVGPRTRRTIKMALDTGATYTMIPMGIALSIGYDPALSKKRIEVITAGGKEYAPIITIDSIRFLGIEVRNLDVVCHDLPPQASVKGLLGLNFLSHFKINLDFEKGILSLRRISRKR